MTVAIDASVIVAALVDAGKEGRWAESTIVEDYAVAPELVLVETSNVLRRSVLGSYRRSKQTALTAI